MEILLIFLGYISAFLLGMLCIQLLKRQRNKVHFYVARDKDGELWLYLGKPIRGTNEFYCGSDERAFSLAYRIDRFGLKEDDYDYLKWEEL